MIRYLPMIFGINTGNKWIANFLTVLTLSVLALTLFVITVSISSSDEIKVLVVKISCSIAFASKIVSFVIIKLNSNKIFQLYDRIKKYQTEGFIKHNDYFSTIISILFVIISTGFTTTIHFRGSHFNRIYEELIEKLDLLPVNQKIQVFYIHFYLHAWKIILELMYRHFNNRYTSIMESFIKELDRRQNRPDRSVIINAQRTLLKVMEFE
jgi:hypothetical protein